MVQLDKVLQDWDKILLEQACATITEVRLNHYKLEDNDEIHRRLEKLLHMILFSLKEEDATPLIEYISEVAKARFSSHYDLYEVQTSINILEEIIWKRTLASVSPDEVAGALGKINAIFGIAKDTLAQRYVELTAREHIT